MFPLYAYLHIYMFIYSQLKIDVFEGVSLTSLCQRQ